MKSISKFITESRIIKNKKFLKILSKAGWTDITLEDDSGTVYIYDDNNSVNLYDSAWYGIHFKDQSPEQWVLDIVIKYFTDGNIEEIKESPYINPNFEYLNTLCDLLDKKDKDFYKEKISEFSKKY